MSIKQKDKILTYAQAKELKWFCENVTGLYPDFYKAREQFEAFASRLERLEKTSQMIERFFATNPQEYVSSVEHGQAE